MGVNKDATQRGDKVSLDQATGLWGRGKTHREPLIDVSPIGLRFQPFGLVQDPARHRLVRAHEHGEVRKEIEEVHVLFVFRFQRRDDDARDSLVDLASDARVAQAFKRHAASFLCDVVEVEYGASAENFVLEGVKVVEVQLLDVLL